MSAILPNGTRSTPAASRYAVEIQEREIASIENSEPMVGRAMLNAERSNGVIKPTRTAIKVLFFGDRFPACLVP